MFSQETVDQCLRDIIENHWNVQNIQNAINKYQKIQEPQIEPFTLNTHTNSFTTQQVHAFVPAPDLIKSYQSTFAKANQNQRIVNTTNYKLKANFAEAVPRKNIFNERVMHNTQELLTQQPIMIDSLEDNILKRLKGKEIEATIPNMEQTLFNHQLSELQKKEVTVEHTLPLSEWKKIRAKLAVTK